MTTSNFFVLYRLNNVPYGNAKSRQFENIVKWSNNNGGCGIYPCAVSINFEINIFLEHSDWLFLYWVMSCDSLLL